MRPLDLSLISLPVVGTGGIPPSELSRNRTETIERRAPIDEGPKGIASELWSLSGALSDAQVAFVERKLHYLSDTQIEHFAQTTNLSERSASFRKMKGAKQKVDELHAQLGNMDADDHVRAEVNALVESKSLTPAMMAKLQLVMLAGPVSRKLSDLLDWSKPFDLSKLQDKEMLSSDQEALERLHEATLAQPDPEKFLRATAYELSLADRELVVRLVQQLGIDAVKKAIPGLQAESVADVAEAIADQSKVSGYLRTQRISGAIEVYRPTPHTKALVAKATAQLTRADSFARENNVTLASGKEALTRARGLYSEAAQSFRDVLVQDRMALQDPAVKAWMARRGKALFVGGALREVRSGATEGAIRESLRKALSFLPGVKKNDGPRLAEPKLIERLEKKLGFDPSGSLDARQEAALVAELEQSLLIGEKADPLTAVQLAPGVSKTSDVVMVFAPGVVPIDGVLDKSFAALGELGIETVMAETGCFHSEQENAADLRAAFKKALKKNPNAKILLMGYSQGAANSLYFLDQLRSGSEADRALAGRVKGMVSLYGAHNGSTAAEDGTELLKSILGHLPWDQVRYALTADKHVGRFLAGGVDSLNRSTRRRFWEIANLPSDMPYVSLSAATAEKEVPAVLLKGYRDMKKSAAKRNLPGDNDTQVLRCDAPLGNSDTPMGQAVRRNTTNIEVHGHHWNPVRACHMKWDDPEKYAFPKSPQVKSQVQLLAELGLL